MNKPIFKRIAAYIFDLIIVTIISALFLKIEILNPYKEKYEELSQQYTEYIQNVDTAKILTDEKILDYSYQISYYGIYTSIVTLIVTILYFVVFQYFNDGKTLGKAIFKIKIITSNNKKPKIYQLFIRSIIINSLLTSSVLIIMIKFLSRSEFETGSTIVQLIDLGLLFASFSMILIRADGKGIHDLIAKTQVVNNDYEIIKKTEKTHDESNNSQVVNINKVIIKEANIKKVRVEKKKKVNKKKGE